MSIVPAAMISQPWCLQILLSALVLKTAGIPFVRLTPVPKLQDQGLAPTHDRADLAMPTNQDKLSMLVS